MPVPQIQTDFGRRVRALRLSRGHSQEAFAALANIDRGAYGKIERGEINIGLISIARIATALGVELSELMADITLDTDQIRQLPRSARGPKPIGAQAEPREQTRQYDRQVKE